MMIPVERKHGTEHNNSANPIPKKHLCNSVGFISRGGSIYAVMATPVCHVV